MDWMQLMTTNTPLNRIKDMALWKGDIVATPLGGGITNVNYVVTDGDKKYVVRLGENIPKHHVMRFNELAASRAAHAAGLSPAVIYTEPGITVLQYIECETYSPEDVRKPGNLEKILPLIRTCHMEVPKYLRGPALIFWVFHVIRDYAASLKDAGSEYQNLLPELVKIGNTLEANAGPFDMVYGHNDLLAANLLDDGDRLWLIDWDYAGFNSPLFDLGGLASNNELNESQEIWLLENYFETSIRSELLHRYTAMKCASLLREAMWSMVSEISSDIDFDYATYTTDNLARFRAAYNNYNQT
jgi:thiamine kinase-like enzyme